MKKEYIIAIPAFAPSEDLRNALEEACCLKTAFELQALVYERSAATCHRMAQIVADDSDLQVCSEEPWLTVDGPKERLHQLVDQGVLIEEEEENIEEFDVPKDSLN